MLANKQCEHCGADIILIKNDKTGNFIPLDAREPTYMIDEINKVARRVNVTKVSHFAVCPKQRKAESQG